MNDGLAGPQNRRHVPDTGMGRDRVFARFKVAVSPVKPGHYAECAWIADDLRIGEDFGDVMDAGAFGDDDGGLLFSRPRSRVVPGYALPQADRAAHGNDKDKQGPEYAWPQSPPRVFLRSPTPAYPLL